MAIFDKFQHIMAARQALEGASADPFNVVVERIHSATEAVVNGRSVVLAGTNNYLGLTFHPECIEAACEAVRREGTGTTGSRAANGTYAGHLQLERALAQFYGRPTAMVFSTGYLANLGVLSALGGSDDVILLDGDCHASIYDACRLSSAEVIRFRHNDVDDLERRLRRLGARAANTLIVVEGIYSMLGDRAPLADIVQVKDRYGAQLVVDEAHSLGVVGAGGRGLSEEAGVEDRVDFIVGTFSKSLGATGGFCVSRHPQLELLRYTSRPYIFTASPSPSVVASTLTALKTMKAHPELRTRLWDNARLLYGRLQDLGFALGPEPSPVVAVTLPTRDQALALWTGLLDRGVYVNLVFPPATPNGAFLLRCSVSAAHSREQLERICQAFAELRPVVGLEADLHRAGDSAL